MNSTEIKDKVTNTILDNLDREEKWYKSRSSIQRWSQNKPYTGINQVLLQILKDREEYWSNRRLTFKQVNDLWCSVLKGEKASLVIYYKTLLAEVLEGEETKIKKIPLLKGYYVFNKDQTTLKGEDEKIIHEPQKILDNMKEKPVIKQSHSASYNLLTDEIKMPHKNDFKSLEDYYSTLFHELSHWTGSDTRLARPTIYWVLAQNKEEYAKEELVAEMSASFLSWFSGIDYATRDQSIAYINWRLKATKPNEIFNAISNGWKATEYIMKGKEDLLN